MRKFANLVFVLKTFLNNPHKMNFNQQLSAKCVSLKYLPNKKCIQKFGSVSAHVPSTSDLFDFMSEAL